MVSRTFGRESLVLRMEDGGAVAVTLHWRAARASDVPTYPTILRPHAGNEYELRAKAGADSIDSGTLTIGLRHLQAKASPGFYVKGLARITGNFVDRNFYHRLRSLGSLVRRAISCFFSARPSRCGK